MRVELREIGSNYLIIYLFAFWINIMATFRFISKANMKRKLDRLVLYCISIYKSITTEYQQNFLSFRQ